MLCVRIFLGMHVVFNDYELALTLWSGTSRLFQNRKKAIEQRWKAFPLSLITGIQGHVKKKAATRQRSEQLTHRCSEVLPNPHNLRGFKGRRGVGGSFAPSIKVGVVGFCKARQQSEQPPCHPPSTKPGQRAARCEHFSSPRQRLPFSLAPLRASPSSACVKVTANSGSDPELLKLRERGRPTVSERKDFKFNQPVTGTGTQQGEMKWKRSRQHRD